MGCGSALVKIILFVTNLVFALGGLTLLGLGIAVQLRVKFIVTLLDGFDLAPIFSMVLGSIVFVIAFFGCCGAIRESNCMLVTYSIFLIVLMIAKLALAITIFVKLDTLVEETLPKWLNKAFAEDRETFYSIQSGFKCCGTLGPLQSYPTTQFPPSCCETAPCSYPNNVYTDGCNDVVSQFFDSFGLSIGIVLIIVVAVELVAVIFGLCLANHARNKDRRAHY